MPFILTCPQGHQWESTATEEGATTDLRVRCPVCGTVVENAKPAAMEEETVPARITPAPTEQWRGEDKGGATSVFHSSAGRKPVSGSPALRGLPEVPGYELLAELGRGGMGVVYRARQKGLNRQVALKMILSGAHAAEEQLARFRAEAEAVAQLKHPHIVHIYDVGESDKLCYFSLELVEGGSLADKLNGTPQPPRLAAQFIEILADAIHYAHQHGIIHRDLKPANVLLSGEVAKVPSVTKVIGATLTEFEFGLRTTEYGQPKITDFGLAKPVEGESGLTKSGAILGTPSYMAPEQAESKPVGPAADVYALGAILYEMLTGRPPFRAETPLDTILQLLAEDPVPPRRLQPKLPIDLESICLKCLEKQPGKRYATALALADDLRRFLADEPTLARPTSRFRRVVKWAKRQPALASLLAVSVLAAVTLAGVIIHSNIRLKQERDYALEQKRRAEVSFERAQEAVDQMLTKVGDDKLRNVPLLEELQRDLLEEALKFNQKFLKDSGSDPAIRRETSRAYYRAGRIRVLLGQHEEAAEAFREAIKLQEQLVADYPEQPEYQRHLAASYQGLAGELTEMHRYAEAAQLYVQALELLEPLVREEPAEPEDRRQLAALYSGRGGLFGQMTRWEEVEPAYRQALAIQEELVKDFPKVPGYRRDLAMTFNGLGILLTGRPKEAEQAFRKAVRYHQELVAEFPKEVDYRQGLAQTQTNLATFLAETGQRQEAVKAYRNTVQVQEALAADFPRVPHYRQSSARTHFNLGIALEQSGRRAEAVDAYRQSVSLYETLVGEVPTLPAYREELSGSLHNLGGALADLNRKAEAEPIFRRAVSLLEALVAEYPKYRYYQSQLGRVLNGLAVLLRQREAFDEAVKLLERAIQHQQIARRLNPKKLEYSQYLIGHYTDLAEVRLRQGDHAAVAKIAEQLTPLLPERPEGDYNAACLFSRCVPLAQKDSRLEESQRQKLAESYGNTAVDRLRAALKKAYKDVAHLKRDPDLDPVRSRADFQKLLAELEKKTGSDGK